MRVNVGVAGVTALILFALSSCATKPASTDTAAPPASSVTAPGKSACHGAYLSDVDTSLPGEATPEAAAMAWSKSVLAPSGAPTDGWEAVDDRTLGSGDWIVRVVHVSPDSWHVDGLGCGTPPCHGAYVADVDTSVPGEPTPEAAALAWAKSGAAPSGAPTDGWKAVDDPEEQNGLRKARSGDWLAGVSRTVPGGWIVSGLGCGVTRS
jgi:hypothetical protein